VGELVPKRMGLASANTVAKLISRPMYILSVIAMPAVWLLSVSTSFIVRLFGIKSRENNVTEDEIRSLIKDGTEAGEVRKVEQDIMERALVLGDLRVSSIMTPKVDVSTLRLDMTADEIRVKLSQELHTAYPVYCNRKGDTICGIVGLKQLILKIDSSDFRLRDVVTEPIYFPESMSVYDALDHMKVNKESFALVCDEFGDMSGLITPSDILDGLVGAMPQQTGTPDIKRDDKIFAWVVDAQIPIYDFINYFDLEELYKPSSYSTLGGLILEELRHVPEVGEKFEWNHIGFEILSMKGARIEKVRVMPRSCNGG
ncbi:MAG: hemolysin family protein, partial [Muribaculaceae bacterium]|nr:hemolysin family protein [Muribaculaceae bacterium]